MSDSRYVKVQGGGEHELFASLLDRAHKAGLRSIESKLHTAPTKENGEMAIVHVRVTMESGQVFEAWGDASPKNTKIRPVAMAETRGKGRCLRDALNSGSSEFEDLEGMEPLNRPVEAVREQPRAPDDSMANDSEAPLTDDSAVEREFAVLSGEADDYDNEPEQNAERRQLIDELLSNSKKLGFNNQQITKKMETHWLKADMYELEESASRMRQAVLNQEKNIKERV